MRENVYLKQYCFILDRSIDRQRWMYRIYIHVYVIDDRQETKRYMAKQWLLLATFEDLHIQHAPKSQIIKIQV